MARRHVSVKGDETNWVQTQCAVFKNWVNQNLSARNMEITEFETDFSDGIKLINLYEVAAKKQLGRYNKKPRLPNQMLENVTLALKAMEEDGINLLSIDSEHIVNGSLKLILGLIWRMILHYQIGAMTVKIPVKKVLLLWLQNVIPSQEIGNLTTNWNNGIALCALIDAIKPGTCPHYSQLQPQNALENCRLGLRLANQELGIPNIMTAEQMANPNIDEQSMMTYLSYFIQDDAVGQEHAKELIQSWSKDITFSNFNTDWNDGIRLCTLVESLKPGTIPQYRELDPEDKLANVTLGMDKAESELGVKKLFTPKDLTNPEITEVAVMAYLLQFREAVKPAENHVIIEEPEILELVQQEEEMTVESYLESFTIPELKPEVTADMFDISGAGLTDPQLDEENEFYVRCEEEFDEDALNIKVTGPGLNGGDDDRIMPIVKEKTNDHLITCRYPLDAPGWYTIDLTYKGEHLDRSPISIKIVQDLTRVTVSGSGLGDVFINETAEIKLDTGLDNAQISAYSVSPTMEETAAKILDEGEGTFVIKYMPKMIGLYGLFININGENLPGCPYVARVVDPGAVVVSSKQQNADNEVYILPGGKAEFTVDVSRSGPGTMSAVTTGPHNSITPTQIEQNDDGSMCIVFNPQTVGIYHTDIFWNKRKIYGSPYTIFVSDPGKCVAHGEGLYQARLNEAAGFEVTTIDAGPGKVSGYVVCRDEKIPVEIIKTEDHTYNGQYYPDCLGTFQVHLFYNSTSIRGSPFVAKVCDPSKCRFQVIETNHVKVGDEYSLNVEFDDEAGQGDVSCIITSPCATELPVMIIDNGKNSKQIHFTPKQHGTHKVTVCFGGAPLAGCPYDLEVLEASDVTSVIATGDGLHQAAVNEVTKVHVDCKGAGKGELSASVIGQGTNTLYPVSVKDVGNLTYEIAYSVPNTGAYEFAIKYDDIHITGSPFIVTGYTRTHPEEIVLAGDGLKEGTAGKPVMFTLDGRKAGGGQLTCRCKSPGGKDTYVLISDNKDGTFTIDLNAKEPGLHSVELEWDGKPVPGSPFMVRISQAPDVGKVKVHGPGLKSGLREDYEGSFTVETKGAGPGVLRVRIHGPKGAFKVQMYRKSEEERTIGVLYNPTEAGIYTVNVLWSDEPAQGSPFQVCIADNKQQLARMLESQRLILPDENDGQRINGSMH